MATDAQRTANRNNAESSTGPCTAEGKAASSRNAAKFGLFAMRDFVRPEEVTDHAQLRAALLRDLQPHGAIEQILAGEIFHAAWRLRRCSGVEARLSAEAGENSLDPMHDAAALPTQNAVDRARNQANRILHRAMAELRRVQTERTVRKEWPVARATEMTKQSQFIPRNAACPCGSGVKYERCCGKNAPAPACKPAVLDVAA